MAVSSSNSGPYAPSSAILDFIDRYRNRGLSKPFTPEVLARAGVSDSLVPRTMQALITLGLVDEAGNPTETLEGLRRAPEAEFKQLLGGWISSAYSDVLTFVDAGDDEVAIRDAFRAYNPVGQQPRMVSLFMGLCRAAGLRSDDQSTPAARPRARKSLSQKSAGTGGRRDLSRDPKPPLNSLGPTGVPAPLAGLLTKLPPDGGRWTHEDRAKWIATFTAVLDFCYVIGQPSDSEVKDE